MAGQRRLSFDIVYTQVLQVSVCPKIHNFGWTLKTTWTKALRKRFRFSFALGVVLKLAVLATKLSTVVLACPRHLFAAIEVVRSLQHMQSEVPKHF